MKSHAFLAAAALVALLCPASAPAIAAFDDGGAPIVILSDGDGREMNVGLQEDAREAFEPASLSGEQIADEFKRLCLDTAFAPDAFAAAGARSPLSLEAGTIALPAVGKTPAWDQPVLQSDSARVSLWLGDDSGLKKRPLMIRTRGVNLASGYGPYKASGKQCNFDLKLSSFAADAFVARMNEHLGAPTGKARQQGELRRRPLADPGHKRRIDPGLLRRGRHEEVGRSPPHRRPDRRGEGEMMPARTAALLASGLLLMASPASADPGRSELFASEALRICVATAAEPAAVRDLAAAENWTSIDPALVPIRTRLVRGGKKKKDDKAYTRANGWLVEKEGLALTVGLFDVDGLPRLKQCEVTAMDLDSAAVDAAIKADGRLRGESPMPGGLYTYSGDDVRATYIASDTGSKLLHAFMVN